MTYDEQPFKTFTAKISLWNLLYIALDVIAVLAFCFFAKSSFQTYNDDHYTDGSSLSLWFGIGME